LRPKIDTPTSAVRSGHRTKSKTAVSVCTHVILSPGLCMRAMAVQQVQTTWLKPPVVARPDTLDPEACGLCGMHPPECGASDQWRQGGDRMRIHKAADPSRCTRTARRLLLIPAACDRGPWPRTLPESWSRSPCSPQSPGSRRSPLHRGCPATPSAACRWGCRFW